MGKSSKAQKSYGANQMVYGIMSWPVLLAFIIAGKTTSQEGYL
jgi:hypothetical protein